MSATGESVGILDPSENIYAKWKVSKYSNYNLVGQRLMSPVFSLDNGIASSLQWRLHLYPIGTEWPYKDYVSLFLECLGEVKLTACGTISILNVENNAALERRMELFDERFQQGSTIACGDYKFVSRSFIANDTKSLLKDNTITISCKIVIVADLCSLRNNNTNEQFDKFEHLLKTGQFSDVTLTVGDKRFRLHKAILSSCYPVFQAMFEHDTKESQSNVVDIRDVGYEVMGDMIRFMYMNRVDYVIDCTLAVKLLIATDMYSVTELKNSCERILCECGIGIDSALQLLTVALTYNANRLRTATIEFVIRHLQDFLTQSQFKTLDWNVLKELLAAVAKKKIIF